MDTVDTQTKKPNRGLKWKVATPEQRFCRFLAGIVLRHEVLEHSKVSANAEGSFPSNLSTSSNTS